MERDQVSPNAKRARKRQQKSITPLADRREIPPFFKTQMDGHYFLLCTAHSPGTLRGRGISPQSLRPPITGDMARLPPYDWSDSRLAWQPLVDPHVNQIKALPLKQGCVVTSRVTRR